MPDKPVYELDGDALAEYYGITYAAGHGLALAFSQCRNAGKLEGLNMAAGMADGYGAGQVAQCIGEAIALSTPREVEPAPIFQSLMHRTKGANNG